MRLVGYRRVSTAGQAEDGFGLEVQSAALRLGAQTHSAQLLTIVEDAGESGANGIETRRGLHAALDMIRSGEADGLLVPRLDRLARDLVLQELLIAEIRKLGGVVYSCVPSEDALLRDDASDPGRKMIRQIMGAVAEYERAMIRLRLEGGRLRKAESGGYAGGRPPFGFAAADRGLVEIPAEQKIVRIVEELREAGLSYATIASRLNSAGKLRRGHRWHSEAVRRVITRSA